MKRNLRDTLLTGLLLVGAAGIAGGFAGCTSPYQTAATDVNPAGWERTAELRLENADTVTLQLPVDKPRRVRYAWADNPGKSLLYNEEGLPASPFEIEISNQ